MSPAPSVGTWRPPVPSSAPLSPHLRTSPPHRHEGGVHLEKEGGGWGLAPGQPHHRLGQSRGRKGGAGNEWKRNGWEVEEAQ